MLASTHLSGVQSGPNSLSNERIVQDSIQIATYRPTVEELTKIAMLVANGQVDMPNNLQTDQIQTLSTLVRDLRRDNLLNHIARCIAADIFHNQYSSDGDNP